MSNKNDTKTIKMKQDYDIQSDVLFFYRDIDYDYKKSVRMDENVILDLDQKDKPVAFEILNASKFFNLHNKFPLTRPVLIDLDIDIDEENIVMEGTFTILIRQRKEPKSVKTITDNLLNIPTQDMQLATA